MKFYSLTKILKRKAKYNIIYGERSNGKTYAVLKYGLEKYIKSGDEMAIIRRWGEDFKGKRGQTMFRGLVNNGEVKKLSHGQWTDIIYYSSKWYLCYYDDDGNRITDINPFCYGFALTEQEHDKSTSYDKVTTVLFDEFISRKMYIPDEFVDFMNTLSTIIRFRTNVSIFMCGNTVNKYACPYFKEMGLTNYKTQEQGTIDVYSYGESGLTVAVEYTAETPDKDKPSNVYFAFNNPKLNMIKSGAWELDVYPHCPIKYRPNDIKFKYFIIFDNETLQCEIVVKGKDQFTFIHPFTSEIKKTDTELIYTPEPNPQKNYVRKITKPRNNIQKRIAEFYIRDKIFYSDNETGEIVRNYLNWCAS